MAAWANESGILRKNKSNDNVDELLVFGYACKLFRDDDKAAYIDKGNHLIPWMGEDSLKIDRYDGRGALSDLAPYEASCEGYDAMRWLGLNESDRKIEQMCDKERYYSLRVNEEEENMYKEEERKRQTQTAKEFQYSYDVPRENEEAEGVPTVEEEDEVFLPTPQLDVPVDVNIPKTVKENARIEKTAMFVHKQGLQMEILIKAKQSDNPQFGFLNQGHELYKYYRHVLNAIKNGRYQIGPVDKPEETSKEVSEETSTYEGHYLHPSLVTTSVVPQPEISVPYKPSPNCTYSQLVNRIQGNNNNQATPAPSGQSEETTQQTPVEMTAEQQQYYQYYYSAQYYEYYKQLAQTYQQNGQNVQPPDLNDLDPSIQAYIQQMAYAQYLQNHQQSNINPYAQIVSNVSAKDANAVVTTQPQEPKTKAEESVKKPLLSIVQYGSDSDDESDKEEDLPMPTGDTQIVIDKMASYVAKNGDQFEEIVRSKGDPRFEFLNQNHQFYKYYRQKLKGLTTNDKPEKTAAQPQKVQKKEKKVITPVSFSIKKPKEEPPKDIKSALPMEESDENEEEITEEVATPPQPPSESPPVIEDPPPPPPPPPPSPPKSPEAPEEVTVVNGAVLDADDPLLDMIDLTDDYEERKDAKRVEDKLKDKLAAAARERMVSVARDRALQLERKKKAEAFLRLKSAEQQSRTVEEKPRKNEKDKRSSRESSTSRSNKKKKHKRRHSRDSSRRKKSKRKRRSSSSSSSPHQ